MKTILGDLSYMQASYKTGISAEYIRMMVNGRVPSETALEKIAKGLGADVSALRIAAGYDQSPNPVERVEFALADFDHLEHWQMDMIHRLVDAKGKK